MVVEILLNSFCQSLFFCYYEREKFLENIERKLLACVSINNTIGSEKYGNASMIFKLLANRPEIIVKHNEGEFDTNLARKIANKHALYGDESKPKDFLSYRTDKYRFLYISRKQNPMNICTLYLF